MSVPQFSLRLKDIEDSLRRNGQIRVVHEMHLTTFTKDNYFNVMMIFISVWFQFF